MAAFDANQHFILEWLSHAVESGAFDEKVPLEVVEGNGARSMSTAFPVPMESPIEPVEPAVTESSPPMDLATHVSRRDEKGSVFAENIAGSTATLAALTRRD